MCCLDSVWSTATARGLPRSGIKTPRKDLVLAHHLLTLGACSAPIAPTSLCRDGSIFTAACCSDGLEVSKFEYSSFYKPLPSAYLKKAFSEPDVSLSRGLLKGWVPGRQGNTSALAAQKGWSWQEGEGEGRGSKMETLCLTNYCRRID